MVSNPYSHDSGVPSPECEDDKPNGSECDALLLQKPKRRWYQFRLRTLLIVPGSSCAINRLRACPTAWRRATAPASERATAGGPATGSMRMPTTTLTRPSRCAFARKAGTSDLTAFAPNATVLVATDKPSNSSNAARHADTPLHARAVAKSSRRPIMPIANRIH